MVQLFNYIVIVQLFNYTVIEQIYNYRVYQLNPYKFVRRLATFIPYKFAVLIR